MLSYLREPLIRTIAPGLPHKIVDIACPLHGTREGKRVWMAAHSAAGGMEERTAGVDTQRVELAGGGALPLQLDLGLRYIRGGGQDARC